MTAGTSRAGSWTMSRARWRRACAWAASTWRAGSRGAGAKVQAATARTAVACARTMPPSAAVFSTRSLDASRAGSSGGRHHDLDEQAGAGQLGLDAGAHRRVLGIHPFVPGEVVGPEEPHVGEPHLGGQQLRLVGAGPGEEVVDAVEGLLGLGGDVADRIAGDPADVHPIALRDDAADDRLEVRAVHDEVALDVHDGTPFG